jgi:hypothetical protein
MESIKSRNEAAEVSQLAAQGVTRIIVRDEE